MLKTSDIQYFPTGPMPLGPPNPGIRKPETSDDRNLLAKHADIYPLVSFDHSF